jgi:hypothetical protein
MVLRTVMQGEPGLDQIASDLAGQRRERVAVSEPAAIAVGQPGHRVRQFRALGKGTQRAQIRRLVSQVRVGRVIHSKKVV